MFLLTLVSCVVEMTSLEATRYLFVITGVGDKWAYASLNHAFFFAHKSGERWGVGTNRRFDVDHVTGIFSYSSRASGSVRIDDFG